MKILQSKCRRHETRHLRHPVNWLLLLASFLLLLAACGSGAAHYVLEGASLWGDSLTEQSGDRVAQRLAGVPVTNHGRPGQTARQALNGQYGDLSPMATTFAQDMATLPDSVVVVTSWGTNEALHGVSVDQFRADMLDVIAAVKGKRIVIESPPLLTNPQNGANDVMPAYRAMLRTLGVTVCDSAAHPPFEDGGIHPTGAGYDYRADALAGCLRAL